MSILTDRLSNDENELQKVVARLQELQTELNRLREYALRLDGQVALLRELIAEENKNVKSTEPLSQ